MRRRIVELWNDLKRRRMFSVAALYTVAAWALVQVCGLVFPAFGAPPWMLRAVLVLSLIHI